MQLYTVQVRTRSVIKLTQLQRFHAGNIARTEIRITAELNPEYILHLKHPIAKPPMQLVAEAFK